MSLLQDDGNDSTAEYQYRKLTAGYEVKTFSNHSKYLNSTNYSVNIGKLKHRYFNKISINKKRSKRTKSTFTI